MAVLENARHRLVEGPQRRLTSSVLNSFSTFSPPDRKAIRQPATSFKLAWVIFRLMPTSSFSSGKMYDPARRMVMGARGVPKLIAREACRRDIFASSRRPAR